MTIAAKISDQVFIHLAPQMEEIYETATRLTICHQIDTPGTHIAKLAAQRQPKRLRIFDENNPPFDDFIKAGKEGAVVGSTELPPEVNVLLHDAFKCHNDTLLARYENDQHKVWAEKSRAATLKRQLEREVRKGTVPEPVLLLMDVAAQIAASNKKSEWQLVTEEMLSARETQQSPRPGA